jgi:protein-S-isoprenylcysteine O-methyltransferase Ste14
METEHTADGQRAQAVHPLKRVAQVLLVAVVLAALLFGLAGTLNWPMAWVFVVFYVGGIALFMGLIETHHPDLVAERAELKPRAGVKRWDVWVTNTYNAMIMAAIVVAALDVRFGWGPDIGLAVEIVALLVAALGMGLIEWAMVTNRFFTGYVRIQMDRGHTAVTLGPYRFVRHPGYVGMIAAALGLPVMLGSPWALIAGIVGAALIVVRTALEDRTLQAELPGYADYAARVRFRLLPGVW